MRDQSAHNLSHSSGETFFMHQSPVKLMTSPPLNKQTKRKELKEGKIKKKSISHLSEGLAEKQRVGERYGIFEGSAHHSL